MSSKTLERVGISLDKIQKTPVLLSGDFGQISFYNQATIGKFKGNLILSNEKNIKYYLYIQKQLDFIVQDEKKHLNLKCDLRPIKEPLYLFFIIGLNNKLKVSFHK